MEERSRYRTKLDKEKLVRPIFMRAAEDAITVYIGASKRGVSYDLVTGIYPTWEAAVKEPEDYKFGIMLSVGILLNLADAMRGTYDHHDGVCLHVKEPSDPVIVSIGSNNVSTFGVMMPMRADPTKVELFWQKPAKK
jgi:hypothetical protein